MKYLCLIAVFVSLLALSSCGPKYPLGMTKPEWRALSAEKQRTAVDKQVQIDQQHAEKQAQEQLARQEADRQAAALEAQRVDALYEDARYGDVIECVIRDAKVDFRPGWKEIQDHAFRRVRSESGYIRLRSTEGNHFVDIWAGFSPNGLKVELCRYAPENRIGGHQCAAITGTTQDLSAGKTQILNIPEIIRGRWSCSLSWRNLRRKS